MANWWESGRCNHQRVTLQAAAASGCPEVSKRGTRFNRYWSAWAAPGLASPRLLRTKGLRIEAARLIAVPEGLFTPIPAALSGSCKKSSARLVSEIVNHDPSGRP